MCWLSTPPAPTKLPVEASSPTVAGCLSPTSTSSRRLTATGPTRTSSDLARIGFLGKLQRKNQAIGFSSGSATATVSGRGAAPRPAPGWAPRTCSSTSALPAGATIHHVPTNQLARTSASKADGRKVSSIVIHPGWDRTKKLNDILAGHDLAVLKMVNKINMYSRTTVPICLPSPRDNYLLKVKTMTRCDLLSGRLICRHFWVWCGDRACEWGPQTPY